MQAGIPVTQQTMVHRPMVPMGMHYEAEIEINDFPQHARWKVCVSYFSNSWLRPRSHSAFLCQCTGLLANDISP